MIPIVYCGNDKTFTGIMLSIISIIRRSNEEIKFHLFTMEYQTTKKKYKPLSNEHVSFLNEMVKSFSPKSEVLKVDLSKQFLEVFEGGKNLKNLYTPYSLLRLLVDDENVLPYDKAIYLDYDVMAVKDIKILWDEDVSDYEYGASLDQLGKFWVNPRYCNSGVLLMNLKLSRESGLFKKAQQKIYKHTYFMPDQTALFRSVKKRKLLPRKYNEQRSIKDDTVLKHFNKYIKWIPFHTVNIKQWDIERVHKTLKIHEFDEDYNIFKLMMNNFENK